MFESGKKRRKKAGVSPIEKPSLRLPGQSSEEEYARICDDTLFVYLLLMVVPVGFALLEWWAWLFPRKPSPIVATVIAIIVVPFAAYRIIKVVKDLRQLRLGINGEKAVAEVLDSYKKSGYEVLHDLAFDGFNIDHVLIGPRGIFCIETKTRTKRSGKPNVVEYNGQTLKVNGMVPDRKPIRQSMAQVFALRDLIREKTKVNPFVRGVVFFPGWTVNRSQAKSPDVWVMNPEHLPNFLEHEKQDALSPEDVRLVYLMLREWQSAVSGG